MALEQAQKFLAEIGTNEKIREARKAMEKPQNEVDELKACAEVAAKFGYDLNVNDLSAVIGEQKQKQAAATKHSLEDEAALSDEDVATVAGGGCNDIAFMAGDAQKITCSDALDVAKQAFCITVYW